MSLEECEYKRCVYGSLLCMVCLFDVHHIVVIAYVNMLLLS